MSEAIERTQNRLDNLRAIEPLISSLRILSQSTMLMALNKKTMLQDYKQEYFKILASLSSTSSSVIELSDPLPVERDPNKSILVVLGSDRGLCGPYNKNLAAGTIDWFNTKSGEKRILAFGTKIQQALQQLDLQFEHYSALGSGSLPRYDLAHRFIYSWLQAYQEGSLNAVDILSFRQTPKGNYQPLVTPLLPISKHFEEVHDYAPAWPPPIIEGDPVEIARRTIEYLTAINFYDIILESIVAENVTRFRLLDNAKENTQDLIEELTMVVQTQRRLAITRQVQELAVGAGLLR
jgi:F-type H+-transporting ATPase subunit gamma